MKKPIIYFLSLLLLSGVYGQVFKSGLRFEDEDSLNNWICEYHHHPNPELFVEAVESLEKLKFIGQGFPEKDSFAIGFMSAIFSQHPGRITNWLDKLNNLPYPGARAVVWTAAAASNASEARKAFEQLASQSNPQERQFINSLLAAPPVDFLAESAAGFFHCDMLWGRYFATGNRNYVVKIIKALGLADETEVWDYKAEAAVSAENYLIVYAGMYTEVMAICQEELSRQPENVKKHLRKVIERAKSYNEKEL